MTSHFDLNPDNAGQLAIWLQRRGVDAVVRGGPKGGSLGGSVIVNQIGGRLVVEPGDRVRVINGRVVL